MKDLVLRRPEKEDIDSLNDFFKLLIEDTFEKNGIIDLLETYESDFIKEKYEYLKEDLESDGQKRYFLIATIDGKIVGTIAYGPSNSDINKCTNGKLKDYIEIGTVFVHPKYQKMGIATLMLNHIYKELKAKGIHEFCLDSGYKIAQKVWLKKFGEPQYMFKNYWGEDTKYMIWVVNLKNVFD